MINLVSVLLLSTALLIFVATVVYLYTMTFSIKVSTRILSTVIMGTLNRDIPITAYQEVVSDIRRTQMKQFTQMSNDRLKEIYPRFSNEELNVLKKDMQKKIKAKEQFIPSKEASVRWLKAHNFFNAFHMMTQFADYYSMVPSKEDLVKEFNTKKSRSNWVKVTRLRRFVLNTANQPLKKFISRDYSISESLTPTGVHFV